MDINVPAPSHQMMDIFVFSFALLLASAASLYMLPSYIMRRNVPGIFLNVWLFTSNLLQAINSATPTDTLIRIPVFCDIATKIFLGTQIVGPVAMFCFAMDLHYYTIICETPFQAERQKRTRNLIQALLCFSIPLAYVAMHTIVQDHRFDLVKEFGCLPAAQTTIPAFLVIWTPVGLMALTIFGYLARHKLYIHYGEWFDDEFSKTYFERELIMSYPIDNIKRQSRMANAELIVAAWAALIFVATLVVYTVIGFVPYSKPDFSRIDVFDTLNNHPGYLGPIHVLLWSGPVYTLILFNYTSKKHVIRAYTYSASYLAGHLANKYSRFHEGRTFLQILGDWCFYTKLYVKSIFKSSKKVEPEGMDRFTRFARRKARRKLPPPPFRRDPWEITLDAKTLEDLFHYSKRWTDSNKGIPTVVLATPAPYERKPPDVPPNSPAPPPKPKRPKRPDNVYLGSLDPVPKLRLPEPPKPKRTRAEEIEYARQVVAEYMLTNANPPLYTIRESPRTSLKTDHSPSKPLSQAEKEENARIRAEMKLNRF